MYALLSIKVSFLVAFHKRNQTDPVSLLYSATIAMRFALPLIYNFFQLLGEDQSAFFKAMGPVREVVFLGPGFNFYFYPIAMPIVALLVAAQIYNRILTCLHMDQFGFGGDNASGYSEEVLEERFDVARAIIIREERINA